MHTWSSRCWECTERITAPMVRRSVSVTFELCRFFFVKSWNRQNGNITVTLKIGQTIVAHQTHDNILKHINVRMTWDGNGQEVALGKLHPAGVVVIHVEFNWPKRSLNGRVRLCCCQDIHQLRSEWKRNRNTRGFTDRGVYQLMTPYLQYLLIIQCFWYGILLGQSKRF